MPHGDSPKWKGRGQIGTLSGRFSLPAAPQRRSRSQANQSALLLQLNDGYRRSLDHPIRSRQNIRWNDEADLLGGFQVDDELELGRPFYGNVSRLCPL